MNSKRTLQRFIDSHAHLTDPEIDSRALLQRAEETGVEIVINICTHAAALEKGFQLQKEFPAMLFNAAGVHPHDAHSENAEQFLQRIKEDAERRRLIAIGETGLDYFYSSQSKEIQKKFLIEHLQLALHADLPLIFHCRNAFPDLFTVCKDHYKEKRAVVHCFTGSEAEAREVLDRGWYLSFTGIITFKNAGNLRDIVSFVPLERLMIETDSPFLAPQPYRGKQNEPAYVVEVARQIAEIKGCTLEEVAAIAFQNTCDFFKLPSQSLSE